MQSTREENCAAVAPTLPACRSATSRFWPSSGRRSLSNKELRNSRRLHRLFRASNRSLTRRRSSTYPERRSGCATATFLSVSLLSSAYSDSNRSRWGCQIPPDPTHSVSTLSAGQPEGCFCRLPETFNPGTLMSFYLQGFFPPRDPCLLPDPILPCRFQSDIPKGSELRGFEGLLPLGIGIPSAAVSRDRGTHTLLVLPP